MSSSAARFLDPVSGRSIPPPQALAAPLSGAKDVFDRLASIALLAVLSPVFVLAAILVKLSSPGPVLFVQERAGLGGRPFRMLKFRSMTEGAHELEDDLAGDGPFFKVRQDARVTAIGRLLRKSSLDELPQLLNVARGDMSLVGPRPLMLREHAALPEDVRRWRFLVKPGITGLWQVSGRSNTTDATRLRLDRIYVEHASLALDLAILARTPAAVIRAEGAV